MKLSVYGFLLAGAVIMSGSAALADGKAVYDANCAACHKMMKPKTGDKAAWAPLIKDGIDSLTANTIKGKGMMPPKGGHANLSDADVKAAVQYMVDQSK
ncbi:cytochrome c5 [Rhizomicrobium palustre]|uniref:Cytochrome c5 n=1 Tax=Rhizomicrobium palustre TaxID=189966 RepID=A0A846MW76_9PROT|nr:c-type cytochrome [Rhizomicrobium palustre]NIK87411.1 cytochrome c5 [Rhizomicrobium palustre]